MQQERLKRSIVANVMIRRDSDTGEKVREEENLFSTLGFVTGACKLN